MVLANQELYLYAKKNDTNHSKLLVLTPGINIKCLSYVLAEQNETQKMYPVEIYNVGEENSNYGITDFPNQFVPSSSGKLTLFFEDQDQQ